MIKPTTYLLTCYDVRNLFSFSQEDTLFFRNSNQNILSIDSFINFPSKNNELSLEEIQKEDQVRYYVNNCKKKELENKNKNIKSKNALFGSNSTSCFSNTPNTHKELFKTLKILINDSSQKLSGRKRKNPILGDNIKKTHNKFAEDNVKRKIQVHLINSIIQYVNEIISEIDLELEYIPVFNKIDYSFKKNINNRVFEENKRKTIENLIETMISLKYKKLSRDSNKKELEKIKKNEVIKNILSQKYINYFKEVYYKNERTIDLSKYGLKKIVNLSKKVKLYEDIFKGKDADEKYRNRVEEVISKKFLVEEF